MYRVQNRRSDTFREALNRFKSPAQDRVTYMKFGSSRHAPPTSIEEEVATAADRPESLMSILHRTSLHSQPKSQSRLFTAYDYFLNQAETHNDRRRSQILLNNDALDAQLDRKEPRLHSSPLPRDSGITSLPTFRAPGRQAPKDSRESLEESFKRLNNLVLRTHLKSILASLEEHTLITSSERIKVDKELERGDKDTLKSLMRGYYQFVENQNATVLASCVKQLALTAI